MMADMKKKACTFTLTDEEHEILSALSDRSDRSRSYVLGSLLRLYVSLDEQIENMHVSPFPSDPDAGLVILDEKKNEWWPVEGDDLLSVAQALVRTIQDGLNLGGR
jgi:predicted transcriptional regulator